MIQPFPFQIKLRDYFKKQTKTWAWFSENQVKQEQNESYKTDLLKNAYRIEPADDIELYAILEKVKGKLGILIPITLYQSQYIEYNNAYIVFLVTEGHLVISGSVLKQLNPDEIEALFAHELSHILLFILENGDFEVTQRIINSIANDRNSDLFYFETARLYQLYTELFCDIGSYKVCGSINPVVNTLVKITTGLEKVSAESYLNQADEILSRIEEGSTGVTHPEMFIRAKSLKLFSEDLENYFTNIDKIVIGKNDLHQLNLFSKLEVFELTKQLIHIILKPNWTQSENASVLFRHYFKEYTKNSNALITDEFKEKILNSKDSLKNYYTYVMLDFALCDPEISEPFLGHIFDVSEQLELEKNMKNTLKKELKLTEKVFKSHMQKCTEALNSVLESQNENTY